jgi:Protein of unknown function (DUF2892)
VRCQRGRAQSSARPRRVRTCFSASPIGIDAGSIVGIVLFALAAIMLGTSAIGFCPLHTLFHFETSKHTPVPH